MRLKRHLPLWITFIAGFSIAINLKAQINFPEGSSYKFLKGSEALSLSSNWMQPGFDDSSWPTASAPFWYGDGSGGTEITDMMNAYSTFYLRTTFDAATVKNINQINVSTDYDDGFIVWVNGQEAFRRYAPEIPSYNAFATELHESGTPENFIADSFMVKLVEGTNLLAVQVFNENLASSDIHFDISLSAEPSAAVLQDTVGITFSHPAGMYGSPFTLTLTSPDATANLVYTLDGSNPQYSATAITAGANASVSIDPASTTGRPATPAVTVRASIIKNGYLASIPRTRTYIFLDKVLSQSYPGGSWPDYDVNGQIIDLEMDSKIVNDSRYSGKVDDALLDIPSISIVTDNENMFDAGSGIYVNAWGHGINWEKMCSVELINPDGTEGFNVNAGIRIRGGWSRHNDFPKHAFRLFFRQEYGFSKLEYPLFGDEGVDEYDKIDLRTAQNYAWSNGEWNHMTMVREVFSRDCQRDMGQPYTRSRYYHLYLNGMYWGVFQTQERSEARYASDYFGGNKEDYDVVKVSTENWEYRVEATDGVLSTWQQIYNMCHGGFASNEAYFNLEGKNQYGDYVPGKQVYVDIDNLIDYMLTIFYTGNFDAPTSSFGNNQGPNNFYALFNRDDDSKGFVFFNHDAEHALMIDEVNPGIGLYENRVTLEGMNVSGVTGFHPQWLHEKLTANKEYRQRFIDRVARHMTAGGALTEEKCLERFNKRVDELDMAIIAESARWGDSKSDYARNKNDQWLPEINRIRNEFFPVRTDIVLDQMRDAGIWTNILPPDAYISGSLLRELRYNISGSEVVTLKNPKSEGTIYYTLDGIDPRMTGGAISTRAIQYNNENIMLNGSALIKARIYNNGSWSGIREITFVSRRDDLSKLKVTELHYHPEDIIDGQDTTNGKSYEFIEFKNIGETALNLSGLVLDSAVYYEFPNGVILPPYKFYVIATKPKYFFQKYGRTPSGNCEGFFDNSGEFVLLNDSQGNEILSFTYFDDSPWPETPDGEGASLVAIEKYPTNDPNEYIYWRASTVLNGSPFSDDQSITDVEAITYTTGNYTVYPNPTSGLLFLTYQGDGFNDALVRISDVSGSTVYATSIIGAITIDFGSLGVAPGVYIINIREDNQSQTFKVVYTP
ncbi:MAG: CotH kinase family protein [Bacteroidales bacterium]|nr:CotH kinase family protein [Bacteroidales bacterium]MBN2819320.1 CotH kinase family protein [Bacteroidales bacterium]